MSIDLGDVFSNKAVLRVAYEGMVCYAQWQGGKLYAYNGSPFAGGQVSARELNPQKAMLLSPCEPGKVVAIGLNYHLHAKEMNLAVPEEPLVFLKPASSVVGPGAAIVKPSISNRIDYEAELAVVIGKTCCKASEANALDYVLGYTCLNDVTARDLQAKDKQYTRAKSFDTFCPIGPVIALDVDPGSLSVRALVNGQVKQDGNTSDMIFGISRIIAHVSQVMTLDPGDVIATGTPPGVGPFVLGDEVCVEIGGIGVLRNRLG